MKENGSMQYATMSSLTGVILRSPASLVSDSDPRRVLAALAPKLIAIAIAGMAIFGLVVGSYRGGLQSLYAAVKLPLLLLAPLVVALPAVRALYGACDVNASHARLALAALVGMARTGVLAAACGPVLWLFYSMQVDYHLAILLMAGALVLVGLPGLATIVRSLPAGGRHRGVAAATSILLLGLVGAQTGWLLRPFIARPRAEVTFVRPVESDVFSSLSTAYDSARGRYDGWDVGSRGFLASEREAQEERR
jgi:hypothetical protein